MKILLLICLLFCDKVYASNDVYLTTLSIDGYEINYDKDKYDYYIEIGEEKNLLINYELSDDNCYVVVSGNGNFNKNENIIKINVNNKYEYKIHVLKTMSVSKVEEVSNKEYPSIKKEIAKYIVITISCISVFLFSYLMFNKKYYFYI